MKHMSPFYMGVYSLKICHEFYIENNLNLTELYSECNFDLSDFKNPNATIHIDTFIRSLDLMKKNIPIGVTLEEAIFRHLKISDLGNFGFILMSSPTLEDCLDLIVRGFQSVNPSFVFKMMHVNDREFDFIVKNDFYYKHHHESIMNLFVLVFFDLLSFFVDDISCLKRKGEVKIKQFHPENERVITLSKNILPNKSKMGNVKFFEHQKKQIISEVRRYNMEEGFVVKIKAIIKGEITKGIKPKIQFVADKLGVSSKTLSRKLKSYDTNFQTCVDSVIYDATLELIKQGLTTKEIAYSLGFNSIAGLNYLFSKKTGMTIMQYKEASLRLNKLV